MTNRILLPALALFFAACSGSQNTETSIQSNPNQPLEFYGNTQGTTFSVICNDSVNITSEEIENILHNFDLALSAYIPNSTITELNEAPAGVFVYRDSFNYFNRCYILSQQMWQISNGAFDPSVYPLVDGWGFMKDVENVPDSATVDSLRALVGFGKGINFTFHSHTDSIGNIIPEFKITKHNSRAKLDFNAIAQGIAVDVIAEKLEAKGADNYFVEIGGEIRVKGKIQKAIFGQSELINPLKDLLLKIVNCKKLFSWITAVSQPQARTENSTKRTVSNIHTPLIQKQVTRFVTHF
ncbi:MAG: FAD:protein FMN transferase [Crocinitomicaceae bacterium]|nr:FAD:protein FMN transferase [Crocinitomicaceae bacterium]